VGVDWADEGLLGGLEDEDARRERAALLDELHEDGHDLDELRAAVEEGRLAFMPLEDVLGGDGASRMTAEQVAGKTGLSVDFVVRQRRALGLPAPAHDEAAYLPADVEAFEMIQKIREAGFSEEDQLDIARLLGRSMAQIADSVGGLAARTLAQPGDSEREFARRLAGTAEALGPTLGPVLQAALQAHLRQNARHAVVDTADLASGVLPGSRHSAVAFADIVGFTKLGESIAGEELGPVVGRLEELAEEAAEPPVKVVKMIGDAAMLVGPGADCVLDAAKRLVESGEEQGENFPSLRAGVAAGEALARGGDWFGRPVNLASRITDVAKPGSVLVTADVKDEVGEAAWAFSYAGKQKLKGIKGERPLFRARRASEKEDER
jgi:adenylate cyclase